MHLDLDTRDRERECELGREVRDLDFELDLCLVASIVVLGIAEIFIGGLDFRCVGDVDDGDLLFLDVLLR